MWTRWTVFKKSLIDLQVTVGHAALSRPELQRTDRASRDGVGPYKVPRLAQSTWVSELNRSS